MVRFDGQEISVKEKRACLHMEVFYNLGVLRPDKAKRKQRKQLKKELVELLLEMVEKMLLLRK